MNDPIRDAIKILETIKSRYPDDKFIKKKLEEAIKMLEEYRVRISWLHDEPDW